VAANRDATILRDDPPADVAGMAEVTLDARGRLTGFSKVPPQVESPSTAWPEPDWSALFREAGLEPAAFTQAVPEWASPTDSDRHAAWTGVSPDRADWPLRVEAAAYHGRPVFFRVIPPWARPERMVDDRSFNKTLPVSTLFLPLIAVALPVGGALLARRNLRLGRGDRKGAFRVAAFVFATYAIARFLRADHVATARDEVWTLIKVLAYPSLWALQLWVVYVALEPYARRRWPQMLISWKRLLSGGFRDPLVGRDVLLGCLAGVTIGLTYFVTLFPPDWLGIAARLPEPLASGAMPSTFRFVAFRLFVNQFSAVLFALAFLLMIVLFRVLLRSTPLAMALFALIVAWPQLGQDPIVEWTCGLARALLLLATLVRGGLLALAVSLYIAFSLLEVAPSLQLQTWYAMRCLPAALVVIGLAAWGFVRSLGGKPLLGSGLLED
jgi:serine/threonine-protein kinase